MAFSSICKTNGFEIQTKDIHSCHYKEGLARKSIVSKWSRQSFLIILSFNQAVS